MLKGNEVNSNELIKKANEISKIQKTKITEEKITDESNTDLTAEKVFNLMKLKFDPKLSDASMFEDIFNMFSGKVGSNFSGGCGDAMTMHERMFQYLHPYLKPQVSYGTGKGGYEKYGFNRVIVDFYHEKENMAIEIDGENHSQELQKLKDRIKELFLEIEHGVNTIRFTNKEVEDMTMRKLRELERSNQLHLLVRERGES